MITAQDLIRLALLAAQSRAAAPDPADLALMVSAVLMDTVERLTPAQRGQALTRALMAPWPEGFFRSMRASGGLRRLLPEVDALWGVPMLGANGRTIDVGEHQLRLLQHAARRGDTLVVRFAALMLRIGMGGTPRTAWPGHAGHAGHESRGQMLLAGLARRMELPADARELAVQAIRTHDGTSDVQSTALEQVLAIDREVLRGERSAGSS